MRVRLRLESPFKTQGCLQLGLRFAVGAQNFAFRVAFTVAVQNPRMLSETFRVPLLDVRMYAEVYGEFTVQGSGKILQS